MELPIKKPEGDFIRVPTEPTTEMLNAYDEVREATTLHTRVNGRPIVTYNPHQSYWALLNAAPTTGAIFCPDCVLWIEHPRSTLPMSARAYATAIMCDLERAGMKIDLRTAQGYTTQDAVTAIVEAAMETARKEAGSWRSLIGAAFGGRWMRITGRSRRRPDAAAS